MEEIVEITIENFEDFSYDEHDKLIVNQCMITISKIERKQEGYEPSYTFVGTRNNLIWFLDRYLCKHEIDDIMDGV